MKSRQTDRQRNAGDNEEYRFKQRARMANNSPGGNVEDEYFALSGAGGKGQGARIEEVPVAINWLYQVL
jgi:hypothetical protein